jgi:hypothetical protein
LYMYIPFLSGCRPLPKQIFRPRLRSYSVRFAIHSFLLALFLSLSVVLRSSRAIYAQREAYYIDEFLL